MYLFCYGRSAQARNTGGVLLKEAEGEWIENLESFLLSGEERSGRADSAIVLILPQEFCVRLLTERIIPAGGSLPVINISPDGRFAGLLRAGGYNAYGILENISGILGCAALSGEDDGRDIAPDLSRAVLEYNMKPSSEELLSEISEFISGGGCVDIYSDLQIELSEPVLDSLSYRTYLFASNQKNEMAQAYAAANEEDGYAVFITCGALPEVGGNGKVLVLTPRIVVAGLEVSGRADPEYCARICRDSLRGHGINPDSVVTVAVSSIARESEAVKAIAEDLGCFVTFFDSRLLKSVRLPLNGGFGTDRIGSDFCTAAACLASDNGKILMRRSGDRNSLMLTVSLKRNPIRLTD